MLPGCALWPSACEQADLADMCEGIKVGELSERALAYGLCMAAGAVGGGGLRAPVRTGNAYERRLLAEVVQPEDAGAGFSEARRPAPFISVCNQPAPLRMRDRTLL